MVSSLGPKQSNGQCERYRTQRTHFETQQANVEAETRMVRYVYSPYILGMVTLNYMPGMVTLNFMPGMVTLNSMPGMVTLNSMPKRVILNSMQGNLHTKFSMQGIITLNSLCRESSH
ncbi:hypothetical protein CEXT_72801 [Caerostris extrusa]|uniref:Uncharacterized protein n=1 Tax=Caerostris extrusa TaxID=172846 RepID=A0AAV4TM20_CAEEX|nr:hypothetical protein CEXT_72801 [Caerostris extrusa]